MPTAENYYPPFDGHSSPHISIGLSFDQATLKHCLETYGANRVYLIVSTSISKTDNFTKLQAALNDKLVGVRYGVRQHVPWTDVLEIAKELHSTKADLLVTLGAGSLTDAAKVSAFAAANGAFTEDSLSKLHAGAKPDPASIKANHVPIVCIPTSLSGGEYTPFAGATDFRTHQKCSFQHPSIGPSLIILDPALCTTTPAKVWLASGMRSVDHCVEGLTSVFFSPQSDAPAEKRQEAEKALLEGLGRLLPGLLSTRRDPSDPEARRQSQLAVVAAMRGMKLGVPMGASHAIGHQLGPLGVGHGETSCVMLPAVLRWNLDSGRQEGWVRERQSLVLGVFWGIEPVASALRNRGQDTEMSSLGDVVEAYVRELGLPASLKEVGVGREQFAKLAENSMKDAWIRTNPVQITTSQEVNVILTMAAGDGLPPIQGQPGKPGPES
ncbi:Dehydroquinate synthase-like protein [Coniochaeta ligniaria NRRL 30616]|uniref:Dehydroquinate synthase-like protein n=1 Tax=Coniochaeta ligniaria NRRL 30616 TaxID=1408157 RepID=A0A1J7IG20_9PEZI|nr:Dehydroquinate synthase-like protein [Coniochaeta ligniaria NRRL 30616]